MLPIKLDIEILARELAILLANLEDRIRSFETLDRPAYEKWVRLELGPLFTALDELAEVIHARRILAHRVNSLVQNEGLHPREALFVALAKPEGDAEPKEEASPKSDFDPDEIEARRRAKLESKRARRKEEKRQERRAEKQAEPKLKNSSPSKLVTLYRSLARKLHPDSPLALKDLQTSQRLALWHEVQSAYDTSNQDRLLSIAAWLGAKGEGLDLDAGLGVSDRLERIRAMKRSIGRLEASLQTLSTHSAWEFRRKVGSDRKKLRKKAARELEDEIARTQEVLDMLDDFINSIGPPREPKKTVIRKKRAK